MGREAGGRLRTVRNGDVITDRTGAKSRQRGIRHRKIIIVTDVYELVMQRRCESFKVRKLFQPSNIGDSFMPPRQQWTAEALSLSVVRLLSVRPLTSISHDAISLMPGSHRRHRQDKTVFSRLVGDKSRLCAIENFEAVLSSLGMRCELSLVLS